MATTTATATTAKANGTNRTNGTNGNGNGKSNGHNRLPGNGATGGNGKSAAARRLKLERLFIQWETLKADAKETYSEIDRIEAELLESLTLEDSVVLSDGRTGRVLDNYIDKHGQPRNVSYRPCGVRRFEIAIK